MKKTIAIILVALGTTLSAQAQIVFTDSMMGQLAQVKVAVVDSTNAEPVPFASVYLTERKDSTINHFTLTDNKGLAELKEVPYGVYLFHIEMMGYRPWVKEMRFEKWRVDVGTVKLQIDDEFIRAATITDVGNPIIIKQDTIEYNASSFQVGANAMLKDLLVRMPGIDIGDDGKVRVNGEEVKRITVGGRTFFFDDQSMALNNLPASIVDKIRVIDKESEQKRVTGIEDGQREKVMDVALKKEYEDGWFGNVGLKGGTTLDNNNDELRDNRGMLYNANALVSTYNPKDQLTLIGNALNINDVGEAFYFRMGGASADEMPKLSGLTKQAQFGANYNTSRVKDVEITAGSSYKFSHTDAATKTLRTTFREDGDLLSESIDKGSQWGNSVSGNVEAKKEKGKFQFTLDSQFSWQDTHLDKSASSSTSREQEPFSSASAFLNSSDRTEHTDLTQRYFGIGGSGGYKGIGGDDRRAIHAYLNYDHRGTGGTSREWSLTRRGLAEEELDLQYDRLGASNFIGTGLSYAEPLGEKWRLTLNTSFSGSFNESHRDAFNADGTANAYYTSANDNRYLVQRYGATVNYEQKWGSLQLGTSAEGILNRVQARSFGVETLSGDGEWLWHWVPRLSFNWHKEQTNLRSSVYVYQSEPSHSMRIPTLNVSDPTRITVGNVYLRPTSSISASVSFRKGNPKRFSSINARISGDVVLHPIVSAMWYDAFGIRYSVPVNAARPHTTLSLTAGYNRPVNKDKTMTLSLDLGGNYSGTVSYHTTASRPALPTDSFEYGSFMDDFWGSESGERFYGGQSGFTENRTDAYSTTERIHLKYNKGPVSLTLGYTNAFNYAHYSLEGATDVITTQNRAGLAGRYTTPHQFEIGTEFNYNFFTGYAEGYGLPEWHWDASLSKHIGVFTLTLSAHDILGQTRNLSHLDSSDYMQDSYKLILGRYILFGVKWNFGKMNALQNRRAQDASWRLAF
ncbi:MAG: outer membrane beta-barrel protein [Bacteroidales bacterium]|nr:outer membrane beta-barrel protein [Bacteroidales bacterium]